MKHEPQLPLQPLSPPLPERPLPPAPVAAPGNATPSRRRALQWSVGVAAGVAGGSVAWWQSGAMAGAGSASNTVSDNPASASVAATDPTTAALWDMVFDTPAGGTLVLASLRGKPLLINFWATWCPPCVEEMPALDQFFRAHAAHGFQVVGLAVDQPSLVRKFLQRTPISFPIGLAGLGGTELSRSLGNTENKMPFSVVLGGNGSVLHRKIGQVQPADLALWGTIR